jgi:DNA gyrase/topoisomerase IV subunit B
MSEPKIKQLNAFQHARKRTEMYLSSRDPHTQQVLEYVDGKPVIRETTWVPAVFTAFREILDNALDEVITHGHGDKITITYDPEKTVFSVEDNGRGIPIGFDKEHQVHEATMALASTMAGRNFDDRGASRGLNGVGASIVNFCSEYFTVDIWRDGKYFNQQFSEGPSNLVILPPAILPTKAKAAKLTGTKISFKLSPKVFHDMRLPEVFIRARVYEVALCYPKTKIYYNGELISNGKTVEKNLFPKAITVEINEPDFHSKFWLVPNFECEADFSHSLVNAIPTFNGGTHIEGFKRGFYTGMLNALERESKRRKLKPSKVDIATNLLIFNVTEMKEPSFDSQSKTRLINENVATLVKKAMDDVEIFKAIIKKHPEWINEIYERCAERTQKKDDADASREGKRNLRNKVAELEDAVSLDRQKCILFLGEGQSAVSGIGEARDAEIHGGLPLRGKVLNVYGKSIKDILENKALAKIMTAVGLIPGQRAARPALRYGKVYITCDADEDGKNIAGLLVNFFYTLWPELFDAEKEPFIYLFDTPLIIAAKGKQRKYWYNENYDDFDADTHKGWEVTRAKGLAALKKADWDWILVNPKAIPVLDDGNLAEALNLIFSKDTDSADKRKTWIGL